MIEPIPFVDFGGAGNCLHIAHANSYPPSSYRQLAQSLTSHFHVLSMAHRPLWTPTPSHTDFISWHTIAEDILAFFDQQNCKNVIAVGHSLGGVASMYAVIKEPKRFRALILIDPVFFPPSVLQKFAESPEARNQIPLIHLALKRRDRWANREEAFAHFRVKKVFKDLSDVTLWDYLDGGLRDIDTGEVVLTFGKEWEAQIYRTVPTDVWEYVSQIEVPTLAIRAGNSDALFPPAWEYWQTVQSSATFVEVPDTRHLVPLSHPQEVTQIIRDFLHSLSL